MSKQFETKKKTAVQINKFLSALETDKPPAKNSPELSYKYELLLKRYEELEKVFKFHKGIIQNISSGILTIDMNGKISFINHTALETVGYSFKDILGKKLETLFADEKEGREVLEKVLKEKEMYESKETHLLTINKEIIPIGFSTTLLKNPDNEENYGIIFIFRNITYITNLRKQIERMDRLATLGELSAGIAHEIRNPLAGIKTSAQVLEESFSPGDFRSQLVTRIVKEIDRSNELLKRFFNFAKPSKPKQDFYNIEMIIDGVYLLLAPRIKKKCIAFKKVFTNDTPQVYVDESQIEQVVLNVFINVIEAIESSGEISVETGVVNKIKLQEDKPGSRAIYVRISDTGKGIPVDSIEKVFNPFYTTKSDGVGLGLSISSRLLAENGGKIEVESKLNKHTTFSIYLPIMDKVQ